MLAGLVAVALSACGTTVPMAQVKGAGTGLGQGVGGENATSDAAGTAPSGDPTSAGAASGVGSGSQASASGGAGSVGSGSMGSGSSASAGSGGIGATSAAPATLPPTGRGWTRTTISIGYVTQNDFNGTVAKAGYSSVNAGDQVGDIEAVLAAINKEGGLFGRKVVGIDRDNSSTEVSGNPSGTAQSNCAYFKFDAPVIAVLNLQSGLDLPNFRTCMMKAQIPVMSLSIQPITQSIITSLQGYLIPLLTPTYDRLAPVLASRLQAQKYFTGWDTTTGGPSATAPVKVGLLVTDSSQGKEVERLMVKSLSSVGQAPLVYRYSEDGSQKQHDFQSAVLQFRNSGITHVLCDSADFSLFMIQAQSQQFRPRYGISSYAAPQPFVQTLAPPSQLAGALGVGSAPTIDVSAPEDPGHTEGGKYCYKALADGGQTFSGKRFAEAVALALCDGLRATVAAAKASGGLTGPDIVRGIATAGPTFPTAFAFVSGLSPTNSALPGAGRDLGYDGGCSCWTYRGRTYPI